MEGGGQGARCGVSIESPKNRERSWMQKLSVAHLSHSIDYRRVIDSLTKVLQLLLLLNMRVCMEGGGGRGGIGAYVCLALHISDNR